MLNKLADKSDKSELYENVLHLMEGMKCLYTKLEGIPHNSLGDVAQDRQMHGLMDGQMEGPGPFQDSPPAAR